MKHQEKTLQLESIYVKKTYKSQDSFKKKN